MQMDLSLLIEDNIDEILVRIIEFTRRRHKIITDNINNIDMPGFVPVCLDVEQFADIMNGALAEHLLNDRLVLADTESITFQQGGSFEAKTIIDQDAKELFENDIAAYMQTQREKLKENSLHNRIANEILRQKQTAAAALTN